ncbi:c-type cytochrome [Paraburkholderia sp.]|uniref:c-type cytochrome n=1 Tax=Paraburkholderia sp. TaxID=1926495 RepID=UPI003D6F4A17
MNLPILARIRVALVAAVVLKCTCALASSADADADVPAGRALFMQKGCYECHGIFGQGSVSTGPALAPYPVPLAAMQAYVHHPKGQMPPFSEKILSNDEIARIHAYLDSIPSNPAANSIALLNDPVAMKPAGAPTTSVESQVTMAGGVTNHGASIYATNCAGCHGQNGEGGVGPSLVGIAGRLTLDDVESRIREPSGIMPRLYPNPVDAKDVEDVARFMMSLK